jgi:acetyl/propionyl-CoA carboxylase alpha subunit
MLSKLVAYGPDRLSAIKGLSNAIDEYVIEGVQHNSRLVQSVLRHPAFIEGDTPTSFLPTHFPDGFNGVQLTPEENGEFAAAAAAITAARQENFDTAPLHDEDGTSYVRFGGLFGGHNYRVEWPTATTAKVFDLNDEAAEPFTITLDAPVVIDPTRYLAKVSLNGVERNVQVLGEKKNGELKLQMYGSDQTVLVLSKREHELSVHMHPPVIPDTSNLIQSPMPGTLISFAVSEGDEVEIGQEVCVVEAMKVSQGFCLDVTISFAWRRLILNLFSARLFRCKTLFVRPRRPRLANSMSVLVPLWFRTRLLLNSPRNRTFRWFGSWPNPCSNGKRMTKRSILYFEKKKITCCIINNFVSDCRPRIYYR